MKIKSVLVVILLNFLIIHSVFGASPKKYFEPDYNDEATLLEWCRQYADILEYDRSKIIEAHFVTLPKNILGRAVYTENGYIILVNRQHKFINRWEYDENLVHEVCHVYTNNDLEWHIAMIKAAERLNLLKYEILEDEKTDHPLD